MENQVGSFSFPRTRGDGPHDRQACLPYEEWKGYLEFPPHARGWTAVLDCDTVSISALPPHARGWTRSDSDQCRRWRASPARAGMDPGRESFRASSSAFPPHARGWT